MTYTEQRTAEANEARQLAASYTHQQAADALHQAASAWDQQATCDLEHEDAETLHYIADMIAAGNLAGAFGSASRLDTVVREEIPAAVYVYIGGTLTY